MNGFSYFTKVPIKIETPYAELHMATGFIYQWNDIRYLITNWHVVTGHNYETKVPMTKSGRFDELGLVLYNQEGNLIKISLNLYDNDEPLWFEHPSFLEKVDVIAIPLLDRRGESHPIINKIGFIDQNITVGFNTKLSILGFPKGLEANGTPIWTDASIATEISIPINGVPKILLNTNTINGVSGSPVILCAGNGPYSSGTNFIWNGVEKGKIIGIYSGRRILKDELNEIQVQYGIVFKENVIEEIIIGQRRGQNMWI
jgi:hypothetical protein